MFRIASNEPLDSAPTEKQILNHEDYARCEEALADVGVEIVSVEAEPHVLVLNIKGYE